MTLEPDHRVFGIISSGLSQLALEKLPCRPGAEGTIEPRTGSHLLNVVVSRPGEFCQS